MPSSPDAPGRQPLDGRRPASDTGSVLVQRGEPPSLRRARWAWTCALSEDPDSLLVSFIGRPAGFPTGRPPLYAGTARQVERALLVSVGPRSGYAPLSRGRASGRHGVLRIPVEDGWQDRDILDAADGRPRPVFDGTRLLRPPLGTAAGDGTTGVGLGDPRPSWWQPCPMPDGHLVTLAHTITDGDDPQATVPGRPVGTTAVRGTTGTVCEEHDGRRLVTRALWWQYRDAVVSLRSAAPGGPGKPGERAVHTAGALTAVAETLV